MNFQGHEREPGVVLMRVLAIIAPLIVLGALRAFPADPAEVYRAQGKHAEADDLENRAFLILEKALGPPHPHVATPYERIGRQPEAQ